MGDSRFLWVNKTPTSDSLSNSYTESHTRHEIYSHAQVNSKYVERRSKQAASDGRASKAIVKLKGGGAPRGQSSLPIRTSTHTSKRQEPANNSAVILRNDYRRLPPQICGENMSLDPFDCTAIRFDPNSYSLLQFYLEYTSLAPMAWDAAPFGRTRSKLDLDDANIVETCIGNKFHFFTFFSLVTAIMEALGISEMAGRLGPFYSHQALAEMQQQLGQEEVNEEELLYGISRMSIAAVLRHDEFGARAHLRAAKHFVNKLGGFEVLSPINSQRIKYGDLHLAVETLSAPIFEMEFVQVANHIQRQTPDFALDKIGEEVLRVSEVQLPSLHRLLRRTIHHAGILEGVWKYSTSPTPSIEWLASQCSTTLHGLLSRSFQAESDIQLRKAREGTKTVLILWTLVLILFVKGTISDSTVRDSMPTFKDTKLEAMRDFWAPCVYDGLVKWNVVVRSSPSQYGSKDRGTFFLLINVVRSMEIESTVRLGEFMKRLFELEGLYQAQDRRQQVRTMSP